MAVWRVVLEGVTVAGGDHPDAHGCMSDPPDGLGLPPLRTADVPRAGRDGVRQGQDLYGARIVTVEQVTVCDRVCADCAGPDSARARVAEIVRAWSRNCNDAELVIWPDCDPDPVDPDPTVTGPFAAVGRPRVATVDWVAGRADPRCAELLLRFDARDQRLYVQNADGSARQDCVVVSPTVESTCRDYPRCYDGGPDSDSMCYDVDNGQASPPGQADNIGECVCPTITLDGRLNNPTVINDTTGSTVGFAGIIPPGSQVVINTELGTATLDGQDVTFRLTGDPLSMCLPDGSTSQIRLVSFGTNDGGTASVCWRPWVLSA